MLDFLDHRYDVLLSTTIVESGLDIPNANTMFIDEADRYGLADLHQLRGRVGRYKHRAYCYLLVDPNKHIPPNAARRLRAIEEFSDLGAGFAVAMRDLEIRGAGNILGTQQSGHIAMVGYELYCQLLEQAVAPAQAAAAARRRSRSISICPARPTFPAPTCRGCGRRSICIAGWRGWPIARELSDFAEELTDRFGPIPPVVQRLLDADRRPHRRPAMAYRVDPMEGDYVVFGYASGDLIRQLAGKSGGRLRVVDAEECVSAYDAGS